MTVVCCWLDDRHGTKKITAVADGRLSSQIEGEARVVHKDDAVKLFAAPVRCFRIDSMDPGGVFINPYHTDQVGLGFSGSALEGLVVITMIQRAFATLIADGETAPPEPEGLVNLADQILARFMSGHAHPSATTIRMLIFGWHEARPWVGQIEWWKTDPERAEPPAGHAPQSFRYVDNQAIFWIGGHSDLGKRISSERKKLARKADPSCATSKAILALNASKAVEKQLTEIMAKAGTVGGVFAKMELFNKLTGTEAAFSTDAGLSRFHSLPSVSRRARVGPVPVIDQF